MPAYGAEVCGGLPLIMDMGEKQGVGSLVGPHEVADV